MDKVELRMVYFEASEYPLAEHFGRIAVDLEIRAKGPSHADSARATNNLAVVLRAAGQPDAARELYLEALSILRESLPAGHHDTVTTIGNLMGGPASPEELSLWEQALSLAISVNDEAGRLRESARARWCLGQHWLRSGRIREAKDILTAAAKDASGLEPPDPLLHARILFDVGEALETLKPRHAGIRVFQEAVALVTSALGEEHPEVAQGRLKLAYELGRAGQFPAAVRECRTALTVLERVYGSDDPRVAQALAGLGGLLLDSGNPREAKAAYVHALSIMRVGRHTPFTFSRPSIEGYIAACDKQIAQRRSKRGG
jgi:tetratricopeptide (TPR) repeat protein